MIYSFMRVRLLLIDTVQDFADDHGNAKVHFENWLATLKYADWKIPNDITRTFSGNLLGNGSNRVVFNIGGNGSNASE
jgi:mRNA interferase HigB